MLEPRAAQSIVTTAFQGDRLRRRLFDSHKLVSRDSVDRRIRYAQMWRVIIKADNVTAFDKYLILRYLASKDMSYQARRNSDTLQRVFMEELVSESF